MLHAKFQDHEFSHIWAWRHLCHVTCIIFINYRFPFLRRLYIKLVGSAVLEEKMFERCGRRTDRRILELGYIISSPCEPGGSGELLIIGGLNRLNGYPTSPSASEVVTHYYVSPLQGWGDILVFPVRLSVGLSVCLSVCHKIVSAL